MSWMMLRAEDRVPSTEAYPYMHIFFRMDDGSHVAFFELPESPHMGPGREYAALGAASRPPRGRRRDAAAQQGAHRGDGVEVLGPVDHGICKSIYFFDPNGHRLELAVDTNSPEMAKELAGVSGAMLEEWTRTKKAPRPAGWVHGKAR